MFSTRVKKKKKKKKKKTAAAAVANSSGTASALPSRIGSLAPRTTSKRSSLHVKTRSRPWRTSSGRSACTEAVRGVSRTVVGALIYVRGLLCASSRRTGKGGGGRSRRGRGHSRRGELAARWSRLSRRQKMLGAATVVILCVLFVAIFALDSGGGSGGGGFLRGGGGGGSSAGVVEQRWVALAGRRRMCDAEAEMKIVKELQPFVNFSLNRLVHDDGRGNLAITEVVLREKMPGFVPLRSDMPLATRLYTADTAKVLEMLSLAPFFRGLRNRPTQPLQRFFRFVKRNTPSPFIFRRSVVDRFEAYSDNPKKFEIRTGTMVYHGSLSNGSIYQGHYLGGSLADVAKVHHAAHTVMYRHKHRSYIIRLNKDSITSSFLQVLPFKVVFTMKANLIHLDHVSGDNPKPKPKPIGSVTFQMTVYKGSGKQDLEIAVETNKKTQVQNLRVCWTLQNLGKTYFPNRIFTMTSLVNRPVERFKSFALLPEYLKNAADHKNCRFLPQNDPRYCSWERAATHKAYEIMEGTSCGGADNAIWQRPRQLEKRREVEHNVAMMNCLCDLDPACSGGSGGGGKTKKKTTTAATEKKKKKSDGGAMSSTSQTTKSGVGAVNGHGGGEGGAAQDYATCFKRINGGGKKKKKKKKKKKSKGPTKCELLSPTCRTQAQNLHALRNNLEWIALSSAYNDSKYADSPAAFLRFHDPSKLSSIKCACSYSEESAFSECSSESGAAPAQIDAVRLWHTFGVMLPLQKQTVTMSVNLVEGHIFDHLPLMHEYVLQIDSRAASVEGLDTTLGSNDIGYVANAVASMYAADKRALEERRCDMASAKGGATEETGESGRQRVVGPCEGFAYSVATEQWMERLLTFYFHVFARSSSTDWRASCVGDAVAGNFKQMFAASASMLALACEKMLRATASDGRGPSLIYEQCIERFTLCLLPLFVASDDATAIANPGAAAGGSESLVSARAGCYIDTHLRSTASCPTEWPQKMIACHSSVVHALAVLYPHFASGHYHVSTGGGVSTRGRRFSTSIVGLISSLIDSKSLQCVRCSEFGAWCAPGQPSPVCSIHLSPLPFEHPSSSILYTALTRHTRTPRFRAKSV